MNSLTHPQNGVVYIATGARFVQEARRSVASLKRHHPELSCTLVTDSAESYPEFDFCERVENPSYTFEDKIRFGLRNGYEKIVFLDSDTRVSGDLSDLFRILDTHDFAAAMSYSRGYFYSGRTEIPETFPELNSGVMAYRRSKPVERLFERWLDLYRGSSEWQKAYRKQKRMLWDQPALRRVLYENSEIRFCALPTEYNALELTGTFAWGRVKIAHGRNQLEKFEAAINEHPGAGRVYLQQIGAYRGWANMTFRELLRFGLRTNAVVAKGLLKQFAATIRRMMPKGRTLEPALPAEKAPALKN